MDGGPRKALPDAVLRVVLGTQHFLLALVIELGKDLCSRLGDRGSNAIELLETMRRIDEDRVLYVTPLAPRDRCGNLAADHLPSDAQP